jgi:hypothetical protein
MSAVILFLQNLVADGCIWLGVRFGPWLYNWLMGVED